MGEFAIHGHSGRSEESYNRGVDYTGYHVRRKNLGEILRCAQDDDKKENAVIQSNSVTCGN